MKGHNTNVVAKGILAAGCVLIATSCASVSPEEVEELRQTTMALSQRLEQVEAQAADAMARAEEAEAAAGEARSAADEAEICCIENRERMDRMFETLQQK